MKKILCLILFLSFSSLAFGADLNWSLTGTESENLIQANVTGGNISDINDNDANSARNVRYNNAGAFDPLEFEHEIAFTETVSTINKVEIVSHVASAIGGVRYFRVYLYYSGAWHLVLTVDDSGGVNWVKRTNSQEGTWTNVTKIKFYVKGFYGNPLAESFVDFFDYELRAWGPPNYSDIGLRIYDGSSVIKIGTQALDGHALRIRKDDTIYGIPLLATDDPQASAVRIYDGSSVKALPKVD